MKRIPLLLILMALAGCRGGDGAAPDPEVPPPIEWSADMQTIADGNNSATTTGQGDQQKSDAFHEETADD